MRRIGIYYTHYMWFIFCVLGMLSCVAAGISQSAHQWDYGSVLAIYCVIGGIVWLFSAIGAVCYLIDAEAYHSLQRKLKQAQFGQHYVTCDTNGPKVLVLEVMNGKATQRGEYDPDDEEAIIECMEQINQNIRIRQDKVEAAKRLAQTLS